MCPKAVALGCWAVWMVILSVPTPGRASGSSLDGIMVLRLVDADAAQVINGHELGDNPYLAVYVSGEGTYAAVGNKARRSCIAWAREGSYTGTSITFGLPPTEQTVEQYPSICQPFTLSLEADGTPRITAENAVGSSSPLAPGAQTVRYSRRQKIVAHAPLLSMDWALPLYDRFALAGVRLGPLPAMRAALNAQAEVQLGPLQIKHDGARRQLVVHQTPDDRMDSRTVTGDVAEAAFMGWPWDAFFGGRRIVRLPGSSTVAAFDSALASRFGTPSLVERSRGSQRRDHYWLFDLAGSQVDADRSGPDTCLETIRVWSELNPLWRFRTDVGPWACSLVVQIRDDASVHGTVKSYEMAAMSGYTAALNHFKWRLGQLKEVRSQIESVQQREVEL